MLASTSSTGFNPLSSAHVSAHDSTDMARLGKQQVYQRNFRFLSTLGFVCIFVSTWEFVLVATSSGLINGGFGGLVYSYIWTMLAYSTVVLSLAELCSMAPTAGGPYHWTSEFASPRLQRVLSYVVGWTSVVAWQPALAGGLYPVAAMVESLGKLHNPDFAMSRWQVSLLMIALGFLTVPFNTIWRKILPAFETIILVLHFTGFFATLAVLWAVGPKNKASDVFGYVVNSGGWSSTGLSLLVGQISVFYCMAGFDSAVHLAEEVVDAAITVPSAMVWAFGLNSVMGLVMLITYLFCIGTLDDALAADQPFVRVFANTGIAGATSLTIILLVLMVGGNMTCLATESRQLWAFARDRGLPYSEWLSKIDANNVPINSIIVTMLTNVVLCLINLGSDFAFNIIIGIQSVGFLATYLVSIACLIHARLTRSSLPPARWSLGRSGLPINIFAVGYTFYLIIFAFFPVEVPVTLNNMNWTIVIFAGVVAVAGGFFITHGRRLYAGPVAFVEGVRESAFEIQGLPGEYGSGSSNHWNDVLPRPKALATTHWVHPGPREN